jgi:hypothetical protein
MIHVQVAPVLPLRVGQATEEWMELEIGTGALSELLD